MYGEGRHYLVADGLDGGNGIHAATWDEAAKYGVEIYMVVPYLMIDGDDPVIALATHGWRSSAATVIAGPWERDSHNGMRQAAEFILASHLQGYRQVMGILLWAADIVAAYRGNAIPIALHILELAMADTDPYLRMEAVHAAGRIGAPARHILKLAAIDGDPDVRLEAVRAAGRIGIK
jgi:hypothetical protein